MSPTRTTGTSAARAKPMLAMSLARRLTSDAEPAPSTSTRSQSAASRPKLSSTAPSSVGFSRLVFARPRVAHDLALHDDLGADVALRLQQHRVHVHAGGHAGGPRLQRLGAADLAAVGRDGSVVRHVLRLERPHPEAAAREDAGQPRDQHRLADVRPRALDHDGAGGHQNSMPSCAFTPAAKWCFTRVISVTRSAASTSAGLALRPVTTICWSGRRALSVATTSATSRWS